MLARTARAFTVVEFLIASFLIIVVLVSSALALDASSRSLAVGQARDTGIEGSYTTLDKLRLLKCGTATGDVGQVLDASGNPVPMRLEEEALAERCAALFSQAPADDSMASSPTGVFPLDPLLRTINAPLPNVILEASTREYQSALRAYWTTSRDEGCPSPAELNSTDRSLSAPTLIRYELFVGWTARNQPFSRTFNHSNSADRDDTRRGLIVRGVPAGELVTLTLSDGSNTGLQIARPSIQARNGSETCAWFPFLSDAATRYTVVSSTTNPTDQPLEPNITEVR